MPTIERLFRHLRLLGVSAVLGFVVAAPSHGQNCSSLIDDFDQFRNSVEGDLDAVWSARLADMALWGNALTEETLLQGLALIHRWEEAHESWWRNAANIGPQLMNFDGVVTGDLRVAGVAGDRMWMTYPSLREKDVRITVRKTGGQANTTVVICRWGKDGNPQLVGRKIEPNGKHTGRVLRETVSNLETEYITVHFDNHSAVNQFEYRVRMEVLDEYEDADESQPQGFSVTTVSDLPNDVEVTWGPYFWMDIFPSNSDGTGTPLATTTVVVATWTSAGSTLSEKLFIEEVDPMVGLMFRPTIERRRNRIRTTGVDPGAITLDRQGSLWLGTLKGSDGTTYRVKLRSRPAP